MWNHESVFAADCEQYKKIIHYNLEITAFRNTDFAATATDIDKFGIVRRNSL